MSLSKILTILYILQATLNGNTQMKAAVLSVSKTISFFAVNLYNQMSFHFPFQIMLRDELLEKA